MIKQCFLALLLVALGSFFLQSCKPAELEVVRNVPFAVVDQVPAAPGCASDDTNQMKQCTVDFIDEFVHKRFSRVGVQAAMGDQELTDQDLFATWTFDEFGNVTQIIVRASNPALEAYLRTIIEELPQFAPARQKDKLATVIYSHVLRWRVR